MRHGGLRHALQRAYHGRAPPHGGSIGRESKGLTAPRCRLSILTPLRPAEGIRPLEGFRDARLHLAPKPRHARSTVGQSVSSVSSDATTLKPSRGARARSAASEARSLVRVCFLDSRGQSSLAAPRRIVQERATMLRCLGSPGWIWSVEKKRPQSSRAGRGE